MAFIGSIGAVLKADNSDFKAKMNEADASVKNLGKGFGGIGVLVGEAANKMTSFVGKFGLIGAAIGGAVVFFRSMVSHIQESKEGLDENTDAAKRMLSYGETIFSVFKSIGSSVLDVAAGIAGAATRAAEWVASLIPVGKELLADLEVQRQIERQTAETLANIEKQKKAAQEVARIKEQIADVQRKSADEAAKQLSITEQIALAEMKVANAQDAVAAAGADRVAAAQAELELARVRADREKLYAEQKKQDIAAEKEARKEEVEAHISAMDRLIAQREEEEEAKVEAHMAAMDRLVAEREAAARIVPVLDDELRKLQQQGTSREQIIAQLRQQGFSEDQISAKLDEQNQKLQAQMQIRSRGRGDAELSERVLEDKVRNLSAQIAEIDRNVLEARYTGGFRAQLEKERQFAQAELAERETLRGRVSMFGEEGAARFYQGDIARFEELLKRIEPETQKRTLNKLEDIEQRLAGSKLFPKRAI